jgi:uncharacterized membrane protein
MADLNSLFKPLSSRVSLEKTKAEFSVADRYEGTDTLIAASSYLYFVSAAILLIRKNNSDFVRFHSKQAFVILIAALLSTLLLPLILKIAANLVLFGFSAYGAYRAYQGFRWYLPFVTELANSIEV